MSELGLLLAINQVLKSIGDFYLTIEEYQRQSLGPIYLMNEIGLSRILNSSPDMRLKLVKSDIIRDTRLNLFLISEI